MRYWWGMCFSAGASFGAAAALGGIGALSVRRAPSRAHLPFAAIPLLFALQQASEGFVWRALERAPFHVGKSRWETAFLVFALFVWPAYLAVALVPIERSTPRRRALGALAGIGGALGAYLMACASFRPSNACIAFGNLYYWVQIDGALKLPALGAYVAIVAAPLFVSSVRGTSALGGAVLAACAGAALLNRAGFVSVWCFFAAMLSLAAVAIARRDGARR